METSQPPDQSAVSEAVTARCAAAGLDLPSWIELHFVDQHPDALADECGLYLVGSQLSGLGQVYLFPHRIKAALSAEGLTDPKLLFSESIVTALHEVGHAAYELVAFGQQIGDPLISVAIPPELDEDEELFAESFAHYLIHGSNPTDFGAFWSEFIPQMANGYRTRFLES